MIGAPHGSLGGRLRFWRSVGSQHVIDVGANSYQARRPTTTNFSLLSVDVTSFSACRRYWFFPNVAIATCSPHHDIAITEQQANLTRIVIVLVYDARLFHFAHFFLAAAAHQSFSLNLKHVRRMVIARTRPANRSARVTPYQPSVPSAVRRNSVGLK